MLLALMGAACGSDAAGASATDTSRSPVREGDPESACTDAFESQVLDWNEPSPLGFSADEVLDALGAEYRGTLTYEDGTTTPLTLGLERRSGEIEYREDMRNVSSFPRPEGYVSRENYCPSGLSFPVKLSFDTGDGAFSDDWRLWLLTETPTRATGDGYPIDLDDLKGGYTLTRADQYDDLDAQLRASFAPGDWSGVLSVVATTFLSTGPDGIAMGEFIDAGTF